jgi:hypothetical protein
MAIEVHRGGESASYWSGSGWGMRLYGWVGRAASLNLRFKLASKGGGTTDVLVEIGETSFPEVAREMVKASAGVTIAAFVRALRGQEVYFNTLASLMIKAAPDVAIRAFGAALKEHNPTQHIQAPERESTTPIAA